MITISVFNSDSGRKCVQMPFYDMERAKQYVEFLKRRKYRYEISVSGHVNRSILQAVGWVESIREGVERYGFNGRRYECRKLPTGGWETQAILWSSEQKVA